MYEMYEHAETACRKHAKPCDPPRDSGHGDRCDHRSRTRCHETFTRHEHVPERKHVNVPEQADLIAPFLPERRPPRPLLPYGNSFGTKETRPKPDHAKHPLALTNLPLVALCRMLASRSQVVGEVSEQQVGLRSERVFVLRVQPTPVPWGRGEQFQLCRVDAVWRRGPFGAGSGSISLFLGFEAARDAGPAEVAVAFAEGELAAEPELVAANKGDAAEIDFGLLQQQCAVTAL